jgi:hypothetical protein
MGFLARLLGNETPPTQLRGAPPSEMALDRYRYMLETAPPHTLELATEEAFAHFTPEQGHELLSHLAAGAPASERALLKATRADDTKALAQAATRAEMARPGAMERLFSSSGRRTGLLSSFALGFLSSAVANGFIEAADDFDSELGVGAGEQGDFDTEDVSFEEQGWGTDLGERDGFDA